jgi:hypothetical protein
VKLDARWIVAAALLFFAWKGSNVSIPWPPESATEAQSPKPPAELLVWAEPLRPILPTMLPKDRQYLSNFYDAMAFVILRDADREPAIVGSTEQFAAFHGGSLRLAIDKAKVGQYPGLAEAIDQTFLAAMGPEVKPIDKATRGKLISACAVLSWTFGIR